MKKSGFILLGLILFTTAFNQGVFDPSENKFKQLGTEIHTPNSYRNGAGHPGHNYWQQRADYEISIFLDDNKQQIKGKEKVTYHNNSPDALSYLWIQLDQNVREKESLGSKITPSVMKDSYSTSSINRQWIEFEGGFNITSVLDETGQALPYHINYTMMRIDLKDPLQPGETYILNIEWWYNINDRQKYGGGRSGMEYFEEDDNYLYTIAQFYPRMAVYSDFEGWQNKQFTGRSEFALNFGNYDVKITVPSDHLVAATGKLINKEEVLTKEQADRLIEAANSFEEPVFIATEKEARKSMKGKANRTSTWHFQAENVRDFGFASSRRFIWDAMAVKFGDRTVMAMSMYPPEGNPLWEQYSTRVVAHTLEVYSAHTFAYPYPVAWSIHTDRIGMEYPMICFNGGRPESDGTYSERTKWSMIGVIIHEIGHNYFPMIVNSDERQWTWMDEGLNTFLQGVAERAWDHNHPSPKGRPADIVDYMKGDKSNIAPIMVNGDMTMQFYPNGYTKPATGLNILRETIMGRELFDFAFKEYSSQWMFKHPTPADFFRIMEDASAVDLDWFWRGWFYGTDHVDLSIDGVSVYTINSGNPKETKEFERHQLNLIPLEIAVQRNIKDFKSVVETDPKMKDFYDNYDKFEVTDHDKKTYAQYLDDLTEEEKSFIYSDKYFVQVDFSNIGGMIMPLIVKFNYVDGTEEVKRIPAEIWTRNNMHTSKVFILDKNIESVELDPNLETADTDTGNNHWPRKIVPSRFELYKQRQISSGNPMQ